MNITLGTRGSASGESAKGSVKEEVSLRDGSSIDLRLINKGKLS